MENKRTGAHLHQLIHGESGRSGKTPAQIMMSGGGSSHHEERKHNFAGGVSTGNAGGFKKGGLPEEKKCRGGRSRFAEGGHAKRREHHSWGAVAGAVLPYIIPHVIDGISNLISGRGKHAAGGAAKVRRGMMTETGKMR